jgi:predicted RNase H-like HicB family nuclease
MEFTVIIEQGENGWLVGQIKEVPAAISQGRTLEGLKANLSDALKLVLASDIDFTININYSLFAH